MRSFTPARVLGTQATGGSTSMRGDWDSFRKVAAVTRAVLVQAAAQQWGVDPAACTVDRGVVSPCGIGTDSVVRLAGHPRGNLAAAGRCAIETAGKLEADRHAAKAARYAHQGQRRHGLRHRRQGARA